MQLEISNESKSRGLKFRKLVLAIGLAFALGGCASVKIYHVRDDDYSTEGYPFWMSKPVVVVKEPFVIGTTSYIVTGQIDSTGKYVLLDGVDYSHGKINFTNTPVDMYPLGTGGASSTSPNSPTPPPAASAATDIVAGGPQAGLREAPTTATPTTATPTTPTPTTPTPTTPTPTTPTPTTPTPTTPTPTTPTPTTPTPTPAGKSSTAVVDNNTYFLTPISNYFDIVWVKDKTEKYVVQVHNGLGSTTNNIASGQGWSLLQLNTNVDNSALTKAVTDTLTSAIQTYINPTSALKGLAATPKSQTTQNSGPQAAVQAVTPAAAKALILSTRVTVKVTVAKAVAPGYYPIDDNISSAQNGSDITETTSKDGAYRLVLPSQPHTVVAFNTYESIIIEPATTDGDKSANLQSYFDSPPATNTANTTNGQNTSPGNASAQTPSKQQTTTPHQGSAKQLTTTFNADLKKIPGPQGAYWVISNLKQSGKNLSATATLNGQGAADKSVVDKDALVAFIAKETRNAYTKSTITITIAN